MSHLFSGRTGSRITPSCLFSCHPWPSAALLFMPTPRHKNRDRRGVLCNDSQFLKVTHLRSLPSVPSAYLQVLFPDLCHFTLSCPLACQTILSHCQSSIRPALFSVLWLLFPALGTRGDGHDSTPRATANVRAAMSAALGTHFQCLSFP